MNLINQSLRNNKFAGVRKIIPITNFVLIFFFSYTNNFKTRKNIWVINEVREFNKIQYAKCKHT